MDGFVHLHLHSQYSLLDGTIRYPDLMKAALADGMNAVALTDHGNLYGAMEFYAAARDAGVKPILGLEAYISPTTRHDRSMGNIQTACYHLILLAMNATGWRNLMKLSSRSFLEGFYYRPRVDRELLSQFNEGLICMTACLGGEVPSALLANQPQRARQIAGQYRDIFGKDRFFIEVQNHGLEEQIKTNPQLADIAKELGVGLVGTNDVHFLRAEDKAFHEVLTCISTGKTLNDPDRFGADYPTDVFFKNSAQMREALKDLPGAADTTLHIADMCDVKLDFSAKHLPVFHTPDGQGAAEYLRKVAYEALAVKFPAGPSTEYIQRLQRELEVIEHKKYSSYLLIVWDFVQYARREGIPCGARGSGCATLLGWCLDISAVDPLRYGLLFERFTDPQRDEAPDFDIDICQEGRGKVIQYVRQKYGHVAQIITYGTLKPKAAIRDVGRVMDIPLPEVDAIAKKVPDGLKVTLKSSLETEPSLKEMYDNDPKVHKLIDFARNVEGLARHAGVHAAGVIVADQPLEDLVPLCRQSDSDEAITQWDGPTCDGKVGLMKMDFLGLRTLTIIERARKLVRERTGENLDPEVLPMDDQKVYELFRQGRTDGVFQFESEGMKGILMQMQPTRIEDLIAANAMYRPGPMELIPTYCARKNGREQVPTVHALVDDILAETYGIMCYQEQVMLVLNRLGKLPLNRALTLIKAISKKKAKTIAAERPNFLDGAKANGIAEAEADQLFELILKFAGYGFNKAHSTRYAIVAYQTAYFKVHYPREFLAATLTYESADTDKVVQYLSEAERMGVKVSTPDINACQADFTVDGDRVRFGLAAVKGVGAKAVDAIVAARKEAGRFRDLYHFCESADLRAVNKTVVEALIKCGAFDALGAHRGAMTAALDHAIELGQAAASDRKSGQMSFFGGGLAPAENAQVRFPDVEPWSEAQLLAAEKETLGFYVSSHPLVKFGRELSSLSWPKGVDLTHLTDAPANSPVVVGCMIASVRRVLTRAKQEQMAMITVEDLTGKLDAVIFPRAYEEFAPVLTPERIVFLVGKLDRSRERPSILVDRVIPIDDALHELTGSLVLRLPANGLGEPHQTELLSLLEKHRGPCAIFLELIPEGRGDVRAVIRADGKWSVKPSRELVDSLISLLGEENIVLHPRPQISNGNGNGNGFGNGHRKFQPRQPAKPAPQPAPLPIKVPAPREPVGPERLDGMPVEEAQA